MVWSKHGESPDQPIERDNSNSSNSDHDRMHEMLNDFGRQFDVGPEADARTMPKEVEEFYKLLAAAEEVLHESTKVTVLEAVTRLMSGKAKFNFSNECYNFIVQLIDDILPPNHKMPKDMCHLTYSTLLSTKDHHLELLRVGLDPMLQSFELHNSPHRWDLTTSSPLLPAKDQPVERLRGSQPQQWTYPTQGPTFGDASQPPPQWMYPGNPMMMYGGQQPMFYPGSQPPYYMPWRPTPPPMTPPVVAVRTQTSPKMKPRRDPPPGAI
ncbi:hypothetical protein U9M48_027386 [Paspalum notatum var. saurae]|uniref:Uncharacterized protein n=1 Tax=Paspalum notatum var. saurae TaxID=547442 RepID=A0AAQ3WZE3_PASNO